MGLGNAPACGHLHGWTRTVTRDITGGGGANGAGDGQGHTLRQLQRPPVLEGPEAASARICEVGHGTTEAAVRKDFIREVQK